MKKFFSMRVIVLCLVALALLMGACNNLNPSPVTQMPTETAIPPTHTPQPTVTPSLTLTLTPTDTPSATPRPYGVIFAVIGDYGADSPAEADVAALVHSWQPDIIITVGDNNYPIGAADTIDANIGKYYHDYISPYTGIYGSGADINRFFPTLGNHDWYTGGAKPYLDYFTLPGNERYYDFVWGPVHFFAIDSDASEPDGMNRSSLQADWLEQELAISTSPWNIVYFHQPPYSSGMEGSVTWMCWPFVAWGVDAVLAGHDHLYERLLVDGIPYFTDGVGGGVLYDFDQILPESQFRYNADYGAMLVTASETEMLFTFVNRWGVLIDSYTVVKL